MQMALGAWVSKVISGVTRLNIPDLNQTTWLDVGG